MNQFSKKSGQVGGQTDKSLNNWNIGNSMKIENWKLKIYLIALLFCLWSNQAHAFIISRPSNYLTINTGLVGWWTFDGPDIVNNVADKSGQGNTGYMMNMATATAKVAGKIGQALKFDGVDDYTAVFDSTSISSLEGSNQAAISFWVKRNGLSVQDGLINRWDVGGDLFAIYITNAGYYARPMWRYGGSGTGGTSLDHTCSGGDCTMFPNRWYHVVAMYNNPTSYVYIDGQLRDTKNGAGGALNTDISTSLQIGKWDTLRLKGSLDDVRIYNRALSNQEIKALYNMGATKLGISSPSGTTLKDGLVGHWTFDGPDIVNNVADKSGNGNTGYMINMATSTAKVAGKIGQALKFDGVDDCVDAGAGASLNITGAVTVAVWVNPKVSIFQKAIVVKSTVGGGSSTQQYHLVDYGSNRVAFIVTNAALAAPLSSQTLTNAVPNNKWSYVVGVYDGIDTTRIYLNGVQVDSDTSVGYGVLNQSSKNLNIGGSHGSGSTFCGSGYVNGLIDDVRIYNRALSNQEIKALYNMGATKLGISSPPGTTLKDGLVGHWTFDGPDIVNNVADKSGQGNTGYMMNMATATAKVAGKIGQALKFDGVDDYVDTVDNPLDVVGDISVSLWMKPENGITENVPINKYNSASDRGWAIVLNDPSGIYFGGRTGVASFFSSGSTNYTLNTWQHVVGIRNGSLWSIYVNGNLGNSDTGGTGSFANSERMFIGKDTNSEGLNFNGSLDDVRVYNRALTSQEVLQLYNLGR